ncbi:Ribonuclease BN, tRNA processing enzyme [Desulfotomaculum arcticum]|uniref:Ribonuclease BN, tRNA processing enzyme n=1 Tax=Desulfotruncus arcticus DSM 17038 TaxID=1121424 RepID=A0A1I2NCL7_9FIRM|nr:Ribonuclease BN, tRNA processing enzyme [Desulfotomaculum arcticum] [Desulfotruncus arcticus DSM 17038]
MLQSNTTNLLLEAGNGSFAELTRHIEYTSLSGQIITHFHPDHYADIYCLRHAIEGARREGRMNSKISLFIPRDPVEISSKIAGYTQAFNTTIIDDLPDVEEINGLKLKTSVAGALKLYFIPITHSLPGYAVLVKGQGKNFFYSGDTGATDMIKKAARDVDLFLCEASGLDKDADYLKSIHLTARQAGELAKAAKARRLLITHFWPEYDPRELLDQARSGFGQEVETAVQGKKYTV